MGYIAGETQQQHYDERPCTHHNYTLLCFVGWFVGGGRKRDAKKKILRNVEESTGAQHTHTNTQTRARGKTFFLQNIKYRRGLFCVCGMFMYSWFK